MAILYHNNNFSVFTQFKNCKKGDDKNKPFCNSLKHRKKRDLYLILQSRKNQQSLFFNGYRSIHNVASHGSGHAFKNGFISKHEMVKRWSIDRFIKFIDCLRLEFLKKTTAKKVFPNFCQLAQGN